MNLFKLTSLLFIIFFIAFPIKGASKKETITFIHTDHLGSPIMATDESGKVKWRKDYQPFGKALTNKDTDNNVGFTGHKDDKSLGLTYMQARWYQPDTGRFMALDPLRYRDVHSFNRYVYGNNNPYKYVDPDGENPLIVFGIMFLLDMVSPADESCNGCLTPVGSPLPPTAKASNLAKKFDDIKIETKVTKSGTKGASGDLTTSSGKTYGGNSTGSSASGGDPRAPMNPQVQEALDNVKNPSRTHGFCCEIDAMNKASNAGDSLKGAKMGPVKLNDSGRVLPACSTCREVKKTLGVE